MGGEHDSSSQLLAGYEYGMYRNEQYNINKNSPVFIAKPWSEVIMDLITKFAVWTGDHSLCKRGVKSTWSKQIA